MTALRFAIAMLVLDKAVFVFDVLMVVKRLKFFISLRSIAAKLGFALGVMV